MFAGQGKFVISHDRDQVERSSTGTDCEASNMAQHESRTVIGIVYRLKGGENKNQINAKKKKTFL